MRSFSFARPPHRVLVVLTGVALLPSGVTGAVAQSGFPFGRELLLDAAPMKGSKRLPSLDIGTNGAAEIGLWCDAVKGQIVVALDTITVIPGPKSARDCPPDRARADDEVIAALSQVTNWRFDGDALELTGPTTLRFRVQTN
jgi:hypothetical protein